MGIFKKLFNIGVKDETPKASENVEQVNTDYENEPFKMVVEDVFKIMGKGIVVTGAIESGSVEVGEDIKIDGMNTVTVSGIESFRKQLSEAHHGQSVGLLIAGVDKDMFSKGTVLTK